ncbi:uncharacterized protein LOC129570455 [Sitodiplosis mosellana]|uniref:uncharacterized protein LOC129570455 n=1 Tax=Sitodiplosis mosellana TaxID=263140 RepID=UPI002444BEE3|nr:uncharacterized protein LOC129570455 [Sitodiplosis mosellana]
MWQTLILLVSFIFVSAFGAPQLDAYYAPQTIQTIGPSTQYVLLYPQYRYVVPRDGEAGEFGNDFWQSLTNYFSSCGDGGGGGAYFRRIIPPTIETKIPEGDTEKQGEAEKEIGIDRKPSKPFYYVLPPSPGFNYYFPQPNLFNQPIIESKYIASSSFRMPNAKSINVQVVSKNGEKNTNNPSNIEISNGHANEKNVN